MVYQQYHTTKRLGSQNWPSKHFGGHGHEKILMGVAMSLSNITNSGFIKQHFCYFMLEHIYGMLNKSRNQL